MIASFCYAAVANATAGVLKCRIMGKIVPPEVRYWKFVEIRGLDDCWPWLGGATGGSYGIFWTGEISTTAHRFGLSLKLGKHVSQLAPHTLHSCDFRLCQNPKHLSEGTAQMNIDDMIAKGRSPIASKTKHIGSRNGQSKLTERDIPGIRTRLEAGEKPGPISRSLGVSHAAIWLIQQGRAWRHVV